ncbi:MAG TPA: NUDIX domain-containing protein [Patescibacteria group bacterium]|jgi:8-oxo-dGTP pyrophosphatase MutT (NUDIX family)|nr:NUDIX domain-containing protein [Patescibacteria group bacterium]
MDKFNSQLFEKDLYFVAVKLFLRIGDKLLITHDIFGSWDLPGGRIRKDEFDKPLESVIKRKVIEELGPTVRYQLGDPEVFFRVERQEHGLDGQLVRIFAIGYDAKFEGGDVGLGDHHDKMEWVNVNSFKPEDYFTGGWLIGVKEYLAKL